MKSTIPGRTGRINTNSAQLELGLWLSLAKGKQLSKNSKAKTFYEMSLFTDQFDMARFVINKCMIGGYLKG